MGQCPMKILEKHFFPTEPSEKVVLPTAMLNIIFAQPAVFSQCSKTPEYATALYDCYRDACE
jgi:hypothetical protein